MQAGYPHIPEGWWRLRPWSSVVETRLEGWENCCPIGFYQEGLDGSKRSFKSSSKDFSQTYDIWKANAGLEHF